VRTVEVGDKLVWISSGLQGTVIGFVGDDPNVQWEDEPENSISGQTLCFDSSLIDAGLVLLEGEEPSSYNAGGIMGVSLESALELSFEL
jgi:hypothetical protein